jgi:hypothetical protein
MLLTGDEFMNDNFRTTRESYEQRFIDAESTYQRYLLLKDLLRWVEDLRELNASKDAQIVNLRKSIKGYDLDEYIERWDD